MKNRIFLLFIPFLFAFSLHNFHLSNTVIEYNQKNQAVQITIRCFIDDMEKVINESNAIVIELGNNRELKNADYYIDNYLSKNFKMSINSVSTKPKYLGKKTEKDIIFFYLELESIKNFNTISIENTILLTSFEDQQNIVRLKIKDKKKSFVLNKNNYSVFYKF